MPYYRRNLYVLCTTVFLASLSWNLIMPYLALFLRQTGATKHALPYWIGAAFAVQCFASMIAQPLWGKIGDASGRKRMIIRAGICLSAVYYLMSICQTPVQIVFTRFLNGALTGFIPGSYALIGTNTPDEEAPRSIATVQAMSNVGLIGGPVVGGVLASLMGYRGSMRLSGTAVLIATLLVWWLVEERNKPARKDDTSLAHDFRVAVRSPMQLSLMLVMFLSWTTALAAGPNLVLHLKGIIGDSPDWVVGAVFSLPAIAFILTAHRWASLGQKSGFQKTIYMGMLVGGLITISLVFVRSIWVFGVIYFAAGAWTAAMSPSTAALTCARITETFRGRAYALQMSAGTLGGIIGPLVAAQLVASYGTASIFAYSGGSLVIGAFAFSALTRRWNKNDALAPIPAPSDQG